MGNFIAIHVLKQFNPGTFNRGDNGEAKQIIIGGINRARFSSQSQKRAIRELMACEEIRTAYIEKLIDKCLSKYVEDGTLTEDEKDIVGNAICSKDVIGSDCWGKLKDSAKSDDTEGKGRVVVTTNASEITSLINTFVTYLKDEGEKKFKDNIKKTAQQAALQDVRISVAKAMFGTMATDGVLGTVDGAVEMGQAFSVDEYMPEPDFFSVKFVGRSGADENDPFYGAYNEFADAESAKYSGETINDGLPLYSNVMYSYSNINVKELERNLNSFVSPRKYVPVETTKDIMLEEIPKFVQAMIEVVPEATQRRSSSHVAPCAVLIEVIKDGSNIQPDWNKIITANAEFSTSEQAVKKLGNFASDKTFRSGDLKQYVMLSSDYKDFAKEFKGVQEINSFNELKSVLKEDILTLID